MKKILLISSLFMIIISLTMLGYKFVSASKKIDELKEILDTQTEQEKYFSPYGYTLDNPNIIQNPYSTSPLTALILFETSYQTKVTLKLYQNNTIYYENTYKENTKHIIPILYLQPNTKNKIEITTSQETKTYYLETPSIDAPSLENIEIKEQQITLTTINNKIYALDNNHNIIWYYDKEVELNPYQLSNNHFLIVTKTNNQYSLMEIDYLGKIYKQINLDNKIYDIKEQEDNLYILSNNLIELNWQTGKITSTYPLSNTYNQIKDLTKTTITLINKEEELTINKKTNQTTTTSTTNTLSINNLTIDYNKESTNYKITKGVKFQNQKETPQSKENIFLINYKKIDNTYKDYNINIKKTDETIIIKGNFKKEDKVYLILDKFLDKRIYNITKNITIINNYKLSGKYSIYLKINNTIYKTNTYINI